MGRSRGDEQVSNMEKLRDKVAKLLRQAEDVVGTPEEAVFQAKAFELMAKYGIEQASVDAAVRGLDVSDLRNAIKWVVKIEGKYAAAQMQLLHNIALALHSRTVYSKNRYSKELHMHVYGVSDHIERIKMLWAILQPQMMRLVDSVRPDYDLRGTEYRYSYDTNEYQQVRTTGAGKLRAYRRSWIAGFGSTVGQRLRSEENKALVHAESSGALVLFRNDAERAELAMREMNPRMGKARASKIDYNGYEHGQRDGRSAAFNHSLQG